MKEIPRKNYLIYLGVCLATFLLLFLFINRVRTMNIEKKSVLTGFLYEITDDNILNNLENYKHLFDIINDEMLKNEKFCENLISVISVKNNYFNINTLEEIVEYDTIKYKNANMCIFGTSGAGKSFYTKLLILRNRLLGIEQYIIDPDREYHILCKNLNGSLLKIGPGSNTFINIFRKRRNYLIILTNKFVFFNREIQFHKR